MITRLAHRVMNEINRVTAVTPGSLVATALLTHAGRGIAHDDLVHVCERLAETLTARGARFSPSLRARRGHERRIRLEAVREACELFIRAGHVVAHRPADLLRGKRPRRRKGLRAGPDVVYVVPDQGRLPLEISKNLIVHFFVDRGLVSTALLARPGHTIVALKDQVRALSRLFKYEFSFRADAGFDRIFEETIGAMVAAGEIEKMADGVAPREEKRPQLVLYARILASFLEGYRVAARSLSVLVRGPLLPKELARKAIPIGAKMHLAGEIQRREAVSQALFENAYMAFVDHGWLARASGKLGLAEPHATEAGAAAIEAKILALRAEG